MAGLSDKTKAAFRSTVDALRRRLLADLEEAVERQYSPGIKDRSRIRLSALDAERWRELQAWLGSSERPHKDAADNLRLLIKERAYSLVNRLVILFQLEARGQRPLRLVSRGVEASEFGRYTEFFAALVKDADRGWLFVLDQVWDQLARELPAMFARQPSHDWLPLPGTTVLWAVDQLAAPELAGAWTDDTTLGWLYQYWNDPDRKAVDEKLNTTTGKVEAHELASKTQLFTERYMVEWLVQNSLGAQWLALCAKQGWTPTAMDTLRGLKQKRQTMSPEALAGSLSEQEQLWKYYVDQELPAATVEAAPERLADLKILDPAMGSGHFLVYVFDFLFNLYQEEAALAGRPFVAEAAVASILERNLHGIDIDNRAVQIGAAALYLKAKELAPGYRLRRLNLVATDLGLAAVQPDDPGLLAFYRSLEQETGIQEHTARRIIEGLKGADHLGSLLDVGKSIRYATEYFAKDGVADSDVLRNLGAFMRRHDSGADLGLGQLADQLDKGLRLIELLGQKYDVIVANPPYLGLAKAEDELADAMQAGYPEGKGDLYSVFMLRALQLLKPNGKTAMITPRGWMFISSFEELRKKLLANHSLVAFGDLDQGAFSDMKDVSVTMFVVSKTRCNANTVFVRPVPKPEIRRDQYQVGKNESGLATQSRSYRFAQERFAEIPGSPMIYWWPEEFRESYLHSNKLSAIGTVKLGMNARDNQRFVFRFWEVNQKTIPILNVGEAPLESARFAPLLMGANGGRWFDSIGWVQKWYRTGLEAKLRVINAYPYLKGNYGFCIANEPSFYQQAISFNSIGTLSFSPRLRKYSCIFSDTANSIFTDQPEGNEVILNSSISNYVLQALNPTIHNTAGDIENLPVLDLLADHTVYLNRARALYDRLFASTETNIEYRYEQLDPREFEVEEARIRDEIDKEIFAHFKPATVAAIYEELGPSPFDYPSWDVVAGGDGSSVPEGFEQAYQDSDSILSLSHRYRLHPDGVLALVRHLGLEHQSQRADRAFQHISWALGVLLGRFDLATGGLVELAGKDGPGIVALAREPASGQSPEPADRPARTWSTRPRTGERAEPGAAAPRGAAGPQTMKNPENPDGLVYLSALDELDSLQARQASLGPNSGGRCLKSLRGILAARWGEERAGALWAEAGAALAGEEGEAALGRWLREDAFARHLSLYENRPIYFPLCSGRKSFLVWVNIHRWHEGTLQGALARYLRPDLQTLEARIRRLREDIARAGAAKDRNLLEAEVAQLDRLREELADFVALLTQVAEKGPDPAAQEVEAPFVMDLDDGVMVNAGALWALLRPLWKKPAEWWKSLSAPSGKKDFDWSHLAMRYWPKRVMAKVKKDPSLAVAHSDYGAYAGRDLFEELHPEAARKWREQEASRSGGARGGGTGSGGGKAGTGVGKKGGGGTSAGAGKRVRPKKNDGGKLGPGLFGEL